MCGIPMYTTRKKCTHMYNLHVKQCRVASSDEIYPGEVSNQGALNVLCAGTRDHQHIQKMVPTRLSGQTAALGCSLDGKGTVGLVRGAVLASAGVLVNVHDVMTPARHQGAIGDTGPQSTPSCTATPSQ